MSNSVLYFYFKHGTSDKSRHNSFLRAVLAQLLDQSTMVSQRFVEDIGSQSEVTLRSTGNLQSLVQRALEDYCLSTLVLDGLDECNVGESQKTIAWLLSLFKFLDPACSRLRILFAGQRDGTVDEMLSTFPAISLETSDHCADIREYCETFCGLIQEKFHITSAFEKQIVELVTNGAKGMFLYARVVMENLLDQTRLTGLKREIQPNVFPAGINFAYERVVQRVLLTAPQPKRDEAAQLLGFIITARRDLRWREIQSFCCIKPATASVDYDDRLFVDSKQLFGSLVDTHHNDGCHGASESVIRMVHETAKRYLVERGLINESLANCRILNFCTEYLASTPFSMCLKPSVIAHHARSGYYGLQDYAIQYWYDHACLYSKSTDREGACAKDPTLSLLANFLKEYALDVATLDTSPTEDLLEFIASDDRDRASHLNLEQRTFSICVEIESLKLEDTKREVFNFLYGPTNVFKCHKPWCPRFFQGYKTSRNRAEHMNAHDRPFVCHFNDCFAADIGFPSGASLNSHTSDHHKQIESTPQFPKESTSSKSEGWFQAIASGNLEALEAMLHAGQHIEALDTARDNALHRAARNGQDVVCKFLLEHGANRYTLSRLGQSISELAVRSGSVKTLDVLIHRRPVAARLHDETVFPALRLAMTPSKREPSERPLRFTHLDQAAEVGYEGILNDVCRANNSEMLASLIQQGLGDFASDEAIWQTIVTNKKLDSGKGSAWETREVMVNMLLSTGKPVVSAKSILGAIKRVHCGISKALLLYPETQSLQPAQLRAFREAAPAKSLTEVVRLVDRLLGNLETQTVEAGSSVTLGNGRDL
ncbi:hypothetical protein C8034_v007836 [Colletotrichum sidae]|uniref:Nephrocystin 3-like N-terminal domain-containing protein n=1 Tax=Colletotrichum sidae TaxID=1347389 RepID=A0A4R8T2D6_9PEZI|nr:hypothetical protein C8034_v007836 [Colletotrichum sidae]